MNLLAVYLIGFNSNDSALTLYDSKDKQERFEMIGGYSHDYVDSLIMMIIIKRIIK